MKSSSDKLPLYDRVVFFVIMTVIIVTIHVFHPASSRREMTCEQVDVASLVSEP